MAVFYWKKSVMGRWVPVVEDDPIKVPKGEKRSPAITVTEDMQGWTLEDFARAFPAPVDLKTEDENPAGNAVVVEQTSEG